MLIQWLLLSSKDKAECFDKYVHKTTHKENYTGGACATQGRRVHRGVWWENLNEKRPPGRPTCKGDDNIKIGLQAAGW